MASALVSKDEITKAQAELPSVPIGWDGEVSLVANRDLFLRLAEKGYKADQIARLSVSEAKAIVGDDIVTLADIDGLSPAEAVDAVQDVIKEAESAAKDASSTAKSKD